MERYKKLLKECGISIYAVKEKTTESVEAFFIKKNLDTRRIRNTSETTIQVCREIEEDGNKFIGRAEVVVNSKSPDEEIKERLLSAYESAKYAKMPFYDINEREVSDEVDARAEFKGKDLLTVAKEFSDAVYEEDNDPAAFINSFELFVTDEHVHIITSKESDVKYVKRIVSGEFVAQCKEPQDVETYMDFKYDAPAINEIKNLVKETLKTTADRAKATEAPESGNYDVILSDRYMPTMMSYYLDRSNAAFIFQGYSSFEKGAKPQGDDVKGDVLDMDLAVTEPFDALAAKMIERPMIKNGELQNIHGAAPFLHYLDLPKIGSYEKVKVHEGNISINDMKKNPCLYVVNFSDFQMDALSGYFGGEIRLAYLFDGKGNVSLVTGGSINGSFLNAQKDIRLSSETIRLYDYEGPKAMLLKNISVAGK